MSRRDLLGTSNMQWDAATNSFLVWDGSAFAQVGPLSAWTAYTPAITYWTHGNATMTGAYVRIGRLVSFWAKAVIGTTTVAHGSDAMGITLPFTTANTVTAAIRGWASFAASGQFPLFPRSQLDTEFLAAIMTSAGSVTSLDAGQVTIADGDVVHVHGTYEVTS